MPQTNGKPHEQNEGYDLAAQLLDYMTRQGYLIKIGNCENCGASIYDVDRKPGDDEGSLVLIIWRELAASGPGHD